ALNALVPPHLYPPSLHDALPILERYERAQELEQETEKQLPHAKQEVAEHNELIKEIESLEQAFASQVKDEELAQASLEQALSQLEERQKLREGLEDAERQVRDNSAAVETAKIKAEEETEKDRKSTRLNSSHV